MRFGGRVSWTLALPAVILAIAVSGPARGQPGKPDQPPAPAAAAAPAPAAPTAGAPASAGANAGGGVVATPPASSAPDALSPMRFMNGPSLRETGRIAVVPAMPMGVIESEGTPKSPNEKSIARAASS